MNENKKITLTFNQLRKLINEASEPENPINPKRIEWEPYDGHKMVTGAFYLFAKKGDFGVKAYIYDPRDKEFWDSGYVLAQEVE